ncbi:DUF4389 domain-containing protein [Actinoplanes sp. GCM10030250]|uniref:DUF4389 domain-containing protein n=1 Tax=Actinoplanes sp. GCM10030250 TaxID=3273376 RepID=UPI0036105943
MDLYPLRVEARRDESLSRWLWLVKWLLLIPHYVTLLVLWIGLVVLTLVAYLAVLITGRYPAPIRAYNLGVLRWTWRVGYYGYPVLGTDTYPPFTLADVPEYPARLHLEHHESPPRWLPLVAWLLAIPHLMILGALSGAAGRTIRDGDTPTVGPISVTLVVLLTAVVALLFTGRYPHGLHDLLVGIARWGLRVTAYLTLLTPRFPPLRLDQGGCEPDPVPEGPARAGPSRHVPVAGPVIWLVAGAVLLVPAAGLGIGGGTLLALDAARDHAGYVTSPTLMLDSSTAAITAENLTITDTGLWTREVVDVGGLRVTATSPAGQSVFVGVAPQASVDSWLAGTAHDRLVGLDSGRAVYNRALGAVRRVAEPAAQDFWLAQASGPGTVALQWDVTSGDYAVVVANADGSAGVAADARGAVRVPGLAALGGGLLATGIVLFLVAVALIGLGGVGLGRRHSDPPPPPQGPVGPLPRLTPQAPAPL